jgi:hypothetical protein
MATYYEGTVTGDGAVDLVGGSSVRFLLAHATVVGQFAREVESTAADHLLRLGWFTFGRNLSTLDATARDYWGPPIHLAFINFRWIPDPNSNGGTIQTIVATRFRWHLSLGAEVHFLVDGA